MKNSTRQSNLSFRLMAIEFRFRDWLHPPIKILEDAGVRSDMTVLDFGCGPGGYSIAAAKLVGPRGKVYAVDIHPLALKSVQKTAVKRGLNSVKVISGDDIAEINAGTVDVALLYDVLHGLADPHAVLTELHRLLKPNGILSTSDHHLEETALQSIITDHDLYRFARRARLTLQFDRVVAGKVEK
jgi:ubiquinone/menaquinone biosynthesis C-methylase UbiE